MTQRFFPILFVLSALVSPAHAKTEFGKLQGAEYRIDVPANWNHGLVVYCHGYDPHPGGVGYDERKPLPPELAVFVKAGYAVIQSGYSAGGWAIEQAIPDVEALRKYFAQTYGTPKETFITGHSLGGLLTVAMIEKYPENYSAGLDLCGVVGNASSVLTRGFDARVLFDYYFPGLLPSPAKVPKDYEMTEALSKRVFDRLRAKPSAAAAVRKLTGIHNDRDLAGTIVFLTYILKDIEQRAGGNPFDNRDTIYTGSADDNVLNDGVKRYAADSGALAYLQRYLTLTGHLTRPVLAIHTTYDPLVPPAIPNEYSLLTREAGTGDLFVQQYVKHDGHCHITPEETEKGFLELKRWKDTHQAPKAGWLH
ncbi:MAG: prolyl oligopeptidase family serine peptidase [Terriglobales bacterium]